MTSVIHEQLSRLSDCLKLFILIIDNIYRLIVIYSCEALPDLAWQSSNLFFTSPLISYIITSFVIHSDIDIHVGFRHIDHAWIHTVHTGFYRQESLCHIAGTTSAAWVNSSKGLLCELMVTLQESYIGRLFAFGCSAVQIQLQHIPYNTNSLW